MPGVPGRIVRVLRAAVVLAVSLSYLSYVFGIWHARFWTAGLGDWIDPYFINYLLEHWYHSLSTLSDPFSPPMFYPAQKTLGYSHALVLYAPFYVPVRIFLHPFQAYSLSLFIVIETGIICLYVIFRRLLRLSFAESLLLTVFFFTSPNVINTTIGVWSQRASVFVIPPILLLMLVAYHRPPGRARLVLASVSGFLATLLLPHDFYSGYFAFLFAALFLVAWVFVEGHVWTALRLFRSPMLALSAAVGTALWSTYLWKYGGVRMRILGLRIASQDWRRPALLSLLCVALFLWLHGISRIRADLADLRSAWLKSRGRGAWMCAVALGCLAGAIIFLWVYLPTYREHSHFPERDLLSQIRVRTWHGWGRAVQDLSPYDTARSFKLVAIAAIVACMPWFRIDFKTRSYVFSAAAVSALVCLMPVQIDGFSIWLSFFRHVPGFSVIRDPTRVIFEYELAFIFAAAALLARLRDRPACRIAICLVFVYVLVTDHRVDRFDYKRPDDVFHRWVEAPIDIDPACRSFYVKQASPEYMSRSDNLWALYAGDSMFIALQRGLPTLNGYSAWGPQGWELTNPQDPGYAEGVRDWIRQHSLSDVCALDIEARTMRLASMN